MRGNMGWLLARMTPRRWTLVASAVALPVVGVGVFLGAVALGKPGLGAGIALVLLLASVVLVVAGGLWLRRKTPALGTTLSGRSFDMASVASGGILSRVLTTAARELSLGLAASEVTYHDVSAFGMATRSVFARNHLAGVATSWRFDPPALAELVRGTAETVDSMLAGTDPAAVLAYARLVGSQQLDETDAATASALYLAVARHPRRGELSPAHLLLLAENLLMGGHRADAAKVLEQVPGQPFPKFLLTLDTFNPFTSADSSGHDAEVAWLSGLNSMYRRVGLEPVDLKASAQSAFDRLACHATESFDDGPLITVIMTCFRPDAAALSTAVSSVVNQSWSQWELLLVDDGSPARYAPILDEIAAQDSRIRVITNTGNEGTYVRRNEALLEARGELVTMHDSDDWMHPRRLEVQARHLLSHPDVMANVSDSVRVTPEIRFAQPRGAVLRLTETSLLFHREQALASVGFFDSVRKGADSGYRRRIESVMGRGVPVVDVQAPLTLVRYDSSSLSGEDMRDGWTHPARVAYSSAVNVWMAGGGRRLDFPLDSRPFPAPPRITGVAPQVKRVDMLLVLDPGEPAGRAQDRQRIERDIRAASSRGNVVAVRFVDCLHAPWRGRHVWAPLQLLVNEGTVIEVLPHDEVEATHVIVVDESCLVGMDGDSVPVKTQRFTVVADPKEANPWTREALKRAEDHLCGGVVARRIALPELSDCLGIGTQ